ncbi:MAG: hypothetical protein EOP09_09100 [Proteobacteria bacterium]|nr:MAG: hypothetical protein EOP09_09100 [Pseudomonadota bacterium]
MSPTRMNLLKTPSLPLLTLACAAQLSTNAVAQEETFPSKPPVQPLSAAEEAKTFQLPPGYRMELLLSEPVIKEPVATAFDGNGRMFVVEMLTYMQDADGTNELVPTSRVSLHWSSKGDGVYDKHTVFADKLLLPRMVLPLGEGQALINETNTLDVHLYTDTDGDGVADKKELWYEGGTRGGNLEHQPSGLVWALDNGIYTTYNSYRLRWTPKGAVKEPTAANNGQWGVGQDNHGNIYFMKENEDGKGKSDLYVSEFKNGNYQTPRNIGLPINTTERESNPFISPDEDYLLYFSSDPAGFGDVDLYISFQKKGKWTTPKNLGSPINSHLAEFCPFVHTKEKRLYFSRQEKQGDKMKEDLLYIDFDIKKYK